VLLVLGAAVFLREKVSRAAWLGIVLISAGVVLVSLS
jgi:undecaprenyl phosphate-alpha-L-ara4N flippase subunit ArnE